MTRVEENLRKVLTERINQSDCRDEYRDLIRSRSAFWDSVEILPIGIVVVTDIVKTKTKEIIRLPKLTEEELRALILQELVDPKNASLFDVERICSRIEETTVSFKITDPRLLKSPTKRNRFVLDIKRGRVFRGFNECLTVIKRSNDQYRTFWDYNKYPATSYSNSKTEEYFIEFSYSNEREPRS